jgi:predicted phage tail protein
LAAQITKNTADIVTIDGKTTATATQLQALKASSRDDDGEGELADALKGWDSTASFAQEVKTTAERDFAQTQRITTMDSRVGNNESKIAIVETTVATNQESTAQQIATLTASVGSNQAAIQSESTVRSNADGALSTRIDTAQATADNASAAVQTVSQAQASSDGKLSTMWSVKMQVTAGGQYVAAGIGLGIENTGAGLQSQFLVSADRFAIVNTIAGGAISVPFAVQGGQVFMNSAFIQDGSITMLKIGQYLQSDNYVAGSQGWRLDKAGNLEFNGPAPGGGRLTMTNRAIKVYDQNGVKRVQLGDLDA